MIGNIFSYVRIEIWTLIIPALLLAIFLPALQCEAHDDMSSVRSISSTFTEMPPVIDGDLGDDCWNSAELQGEFFRRRDPGKGDPSKLETWLRVLNDEEYLYAALEMHGDDPEMLLKSITRRDDNLDVDDTACLYIDTFHDHRSAYFFQVNFLGTQRDIYSTGNGTQVDIGWDAVWDAAAAPLPDGWAVEFRIPFKILRFNWSENMTWGFDVYRGSSQNEEGSEWCYVEDNQNSTLNPNLYGHITDIKNVSKPLLLQSIFSAVGSLDQTNERIESEDSENDWESESDIEGGLDIIWGITPKLTLNAAFNPDFAQVEADPDQINLTGEEILLQERRPFFRENNAIFMAPGFTTPFYSRRIVDIDEGLKITGQIGNSDTAALFVRGADGDQESNLFSVLRLQSPFLKQSSLSGWFIGKYNAGGLDSYENAHDEFYEDVDHDFNLLAGFDAVNRNPERYLLLSWYQTWYGDETRPWYADRPTDDKYYNQIYWVKFGHNWSYEFLHKEVCLGYYPELGFVNASDLDNRTFYQAFFFEDFFREDHQVDSYYFNIPFTLAVPRDTFAEVVKLELHPSCCIRFDCHARISVDYDWAEDETYEKFTEFSRDEEGAIVNPTAAWFADTLAGGNNSINVISTRLSWSDGGWKETGIKFSTGLHYYSKIRQYEFWVNWNFWSKLSAELSLNLLERYDPASEYIKTHDDWIDQENWIFRTKFNYAFNRDFHIRTILSGYIDQDHSADDYAVSMLAAYNYRPGSNFYLVYENQWTPFDAETEALLPFDESIEKQRKLFLKATYMLDF